MTKKTLTYDERLLLIHCLTEHAPELLAKLESLESGKLESSIINRIRSAITDEFIKKGLQEDDEPNKYGFKLEELNEKIASLFLWP